MNTSRDVNPLDELFRNTLENLPDTPGSSGWDAPSDRVWQQVQGTLKTPPASGNHLRTWLVASVVGAAALTGLYLFLSPDTPPAAQPALEQPLQKIETPAPEITAPSTTTTAPVSEPMRKSAKPGSTAGKAAKQEKTGEVQSNTTTPQLNRHTAKPLPGSKDAPHNSKEATEQKRTPERN